MSDTVDSPPYEEAPELHGRHLLVCNSLWYDHRRPEAGFSLGRIITHVEPATGFPFRFDKLFIYFQYWGDPGEYQVRIRLVKLDFEDDDERVMQLGPGGEPWEFRMTSRRPVVVSGLNFVEELGYPIGLVPFPEPGIYEFQLWADGIDEPIVREQVLAEENRYV